MPAATATLHTPTASDYERAIRIINAGRLQEGTARLGEIARRTMDDELRSQCLYSLGEVLYQLNQHGDPLDHGSGFGDQAARGFHRPARREQVVDHEDLGP